MCGCRTGLLKQYAQNVSQRYSVEDIVAFALQKYPANPGTYSTTNFVVLDRVAETVSGKTISDLVNEYVFVPLGMTTSTLPGRFDTGVHPEPAATPYAGPSCLGEFVSVGYLGAELYGDLTEISQGIVMSGTGGAVSSTIKDLLTWAKSGTGDSLLSDEVVKKRHEYDSVLEGSLIVYGMAQYQLGPLGFIVHGVEYEGWYGHNGDAFGFGANAFKNDDLNVAVATGINTCGSTDMHDMVIRVVSQELKGRNVTATEPNGSPAPTEAPNMSPTMSPDTETVQPSSAMSLGHVTCLLGLLVVTSFI